MHGYSRGDEHDAARPKNYSRHEYQKMFVPRLKIHKRSKKEAYVSLILCDSLCVCVWENQINHHHHQHHNWECREKFRIQYSSIVISDGQTFFLFFYIWKLPFFSRFRWIWYGHAKNFSYFLFLFPSFFLNKNKKETSKQFFESWS